MFCLWGAQGNVGTWMNFSLLATSVGVQEAGLAPDSTPVVYLEGLDKG